MTKLSGANGDREIFIFPVPLTTSRIGNLTQLILTLAIRDDHTYIGTVSCLRTYNKFHFDHSCRVCQFITSPPYQDISHMSSGKNWRTKIGLSMVIPEKEAPVRGTTLRTTGPVPADSRQ